MQPSSRTPQQPTYRFETITEEDFVQASVTGERPGSGSSSRGGGGRRGASKPPPQLHVDTSRRASSSAAASPGPASAPGTGGRVPHARTHAHAQSISAHPYLHRPQSRTAGAGSGSGSVSGRVVAGPSGQQHAPVRSARRVSELQSAQTSVGGASASHTGGALPTVGTPMGVSCPASSSWREGLLSLSTVTGTGIATRTGTRCVVDSGVSPSFQLTLDPRSSFQVDGDTSAIGAVASASASASANTTPHVDTDADFQTVSHGHNLVLPFTLEPVQPKRYGIRTDVHFNTEENVITAMFELPGVKRTDLRLTMSVCPFSRVRQVTVSGVSRGMLPQQGHQMRERKFGEFFRTLAVPPETKVRRLYCASLLAPFHCPILVVVPCPLPGFSKTRSRKSDASVCVCLGCQPEDISVLLEDGILTLKIPGGTPAQVEQPQDIPIPTPAPQ